MKFVPADTYHRQAYLEPLGLWVVAEAGTLASLTLDMGAKTVAVAFVPSAAAGAAAGVGGGGAPYDFLRLRVSGEAPVDRPFAFTLSQPPGAGVVRGAYQFPPNPDASQETVAVISFASL